jgi:DNA modification methylase
LNGESRQRGRRRALSHVGGRVETSGAAPAERELLARALDVGSDEASTLAHVHGFHSYPARMHPLTARRLIEALSRPGDTVLDPFAGSGTVPVEARLLGRRALGSDLNPLTAELIALKTRGISAKEAALFARRIEEVRSHADQRRRKKLGATRRYGDEDRALFAAHVLMELDGLMNGIARVPEPGIRRALELVVSSLLTKVSQLSGDTAHHEREKRIASGFTIRFFAKKAGELQGRLLEFTSRLPPRAPPAKALTSDARKLSWVRSGSVALIVTSPPYPGVYDYVIHHEARLRWLGLDALSFERAEIGTRRSARRKSFERALADFRREFLPCLAEMARVLERGGSAVLLMADSVLGDGAFYADEFVPGLAEGAGLTLVAAAAQHRPHFHAPTGHAFRKRPRREHAFLLRKS